MIVKCKKTDCEYHQNVNPLRNIYIGCKKLEITLDEDGQCDEHN